MSDVFVVKKNNNEIILSGNTDLIFCNRRAFRLLKDNSTYIITDNKDIVFDSSSDFNKTLTRIKNIVTIIGADLQFDTEVDDDINEYVLEETKFADFSQKALNIRENDCDITELKRFKDILIDGMPNRTLYDLQMLSAYHLAFSQNACNFSVPGAGKTSIVYGAYTYLKKLPEKDPKHVDFLLIIGPLSSFGPWEQEYEACFGRKVSCKRLVGELNIEAKKQYLYEFMPCELTLLSYASVYSLIDELLFFLTKHKVMVVLDEAHKIKNTSGGVTAESVMRLAEKAKSRVILTGTPAPNGYEDLYNLFKFIWPTKNIIKFHSGQLKDMSKNSSDPRVSMLLESLKPYFIRIKKSDLGIPAAINNPPIVVQMKPLQRKIYDMVESKYIKDIAENKDDKFKKNLVKARIIRLMQAATNPSLLQQPLRDFALDEGITLDDIPEDAELLKAVMDYCVLEVPAKFEEARHLICDLIKTGQKVVVWACYIKTIEAFSDYLCGCGINNKILYGATPVAADGMTQDDADYELTREAIIKEFHEPDSPFKVIIANPFAVAESISLHKACHNAIYLERSFNCAHFIQSKDRIHRYGLANSVVTNYYYLLSENSIDGVIDARLIEKENRLLGIIESMPIPLFDNAGDDGIEDVKAVLKDYAKRIKTM